jgi:hypothetical protein
MRTRKLNASGKGSGDFFVLASPAKNDQVRFVNGDADIKTFGDAVKSADLGITFPDPSSVRALRRGSVKCGTAPPSPVTKTKSSGKKAAKAKEAADASPTAEPPAKRELLPGPCTVELAPSDTVRSID